MSYDWESGQVAKVELEDKRGMEWSEDETKMVYSADEGRMTNHYRYIVFPNADEIKKCLSNGPCVTFTVASKSNTRNPGDAEKGAVPQGGFIHTYWHVQAGTVASDAEGNAEWKKQNEQE